ncbi:MULTISPECIES: WGR domain-containing protein [Rhodobacterales]|uniref:Polymerase n=1 Tax=Pelagivirga sediminicola TaxID=2170575 RepID=A0A2T7G2W0_9RHOB|nr:MULTISPECIES: WGR domain-containing protein [Rhodobacterales]MCQ0090320.1 WGR domain-containing protein [Roseovarius sp. M141]PVA08757.1 polymerase [Pelagivirga sediminicola]
MFPTALRLLRTDPDRKTRRFFLLTVQRDLFGCAFLVREWGYAGTSRRVSYRLFRDEGCAVDALAEDAKRMKNQGYQM